MGHSDGLVTIWNHDEVCTRKKAHRKRIDTIYTTAQRLYTAARDGLRMWKTITLERLAEDFSPIGQTFIVECDLFYTPDPEGIYAAVEGTEKLMAYCAYGMNITVWDLDDFKVAWKFSPFSLDLSVTDNIPDTVNHNAVFDPYGQPYIPGNEEDEVVEGVKNVVVMDDWIVVQAMPFIAQNDNLILINKRTHARFQPSLHSPALTIMRYDRWHMITTHKNFSLCIWCGNEQIRLIPGRFLSYVQTTALRGVDRGLIAKTDNNLIYYEWEKPPPARVSQKSEITVVLERPDTPQRYFTSTPPTVEKRPRQKDDKEKERETKERKKQKLYDFWK